MRVLLAACGCVWIASASLAAAQTIPTRPHIVFILADDLGWGDVGYHGSEIPTPTLDRLASEGVRLEQYYTPSSCTPTRASLMTGRYPFRYGLQQRPLRYWDPVGLPLEERLLPEALKEAGYDTAIVGKWHLGHGDPRYLPTRRGFDRQYGPFFAAHYQTHVVPGYGGLDWHRNDEALREPGYTTELLGDEAVRIIQEADPQRPLFLYVAFTAPHAPLVGQERDLVAVSGIGDPNRRTFAAVVRAMDRAIGRIWRALEESGLADHTLLVFSSDNGGRLLWGASNGSLRGGKQTPYEGGVRVPAFARWPGTLPAGAVVEEPLHVVDWYATLLRVADAPMDSSLPVDGLDIWGTLERSEPSPHAEIVIDLARNRGAIRRGDWKLVLNGAYMSPRWYKREIELFELRSDPGERVNLAAEQPRIVDELWDRLQLYRSQAVPPLPSQASRPLGFEPPEVLGEGPHPGGTWGLANYLKQLVRDWRGESF